MSKTFMFLAVGLLTIGFLGHTVTYADITNDVYFIYPNGGISLVSVGASSNAFANWSGLQGCPQSTSRGEVIGYATNDEAEETTQYNVSYTAAGVAYAGNISCIRDNLSDQSKGDLHFNSDDNFHIDCGRTDSSQVAAAFSVYMEQGMGTSSHVVNANQSAFENNSGVIANGFPTTLNFVFAVDMQFSVDSTTYTCPNVVFGQLGTSSVAKPNWGAETSKQAVGLIEPTATCIASDGLDCIDLVGAFFKDTIKDVAQAIDYALHNENVWWVGQSYNNNNPSASFTLPPNYTDQNGNQINTGNTPSQYQVAIFCQNDQDPDEQTFLIFTQDTQSDKTFSVVSAPPNSPLPTN
jgi:hypothetical protein